MGREEREVERKRAEKKGRELKNEVKCDRGSRDGRKLGGAGGFQEEKGMEEKWVWRMNGAMVGVRR